MALTDPQQRWLAREAEPTLGLTRIRARILLALLEQNDRFGINDIARQLELGVETVRLAIDPLIARDLIELRTHGDPRRTRKAYEVVAGGRLRLLLARLATGSE